MNRRRFYTRLALLTTGTVAVLLALQFFSVFRPYLIFSFFSAGFFLLLSTVMYLLGAQAAMSKDKNAFTRIIMVFTMGKLFLSVVLIVAYHRIFRPGDNYFLIPFFFVYVAYTIFETSFLTKLGKIKAR